MKRIATPNRSWTGATRGWRPAYSLSPLANSSGNRAMLRAMRASSVVSTLHVELGYHRRGKLVRVELAGIGKL